MPRRPIPRIECQCCCCEKRFLVEAWRIKIRPVVFCSRLCLYKAFPKHRPLAERFWDKVQKGSNDQCWLWTGSATSRGYGRITVNKTVVFAHRISWELTHGPIPDGLNVLHNCPDGDNPRCVNPAHLYTGTQKDNMNDAVRKGQIRSGDRNPHTKISDQTVKSIRLRVSSGEASQNQLAREYLVSRRLIQDIIKGSNRKHVD